MTAIIASEKEWKEMTDNKVYTCEKCLWRIWGILAVRHHVEVEGHHTFKVGGTGAIISLG